MGIYEHRGLECTRAGKMRPLQFRAYSAAVPKHPLFARLLGVWRIAFRTGRRAFTGDITVAAGGMALFAMLAAIPMLAAVVSIFGLIANPANIAAHIRVLHNVVPEAVFKFLLEQLQRTASSSSRALSATLVTSALGGLYAARNAVNAFIEGLNRAYGLVDRGTPWRRLYYGFAIAGVAMLGMLIIAIVAVALPAAASALGLDSARWLTHWLRWPIMLLLSGSILVALYDRGPTGMPADSKETPRHDRLRRRLLPGAIVATLMWLLVSFGLSVYVDRLSNYESLYGAFAGVIVLLSWFYFSSLSVLTGAVLNAELLREADATAAKDAAEAAAPAQLV